MTKQSVHSSQEALAIAVRDILVNFGMNTVKRDVIRALAIFRFVQPLIVKEENKKKYNEAFDKLIEQVKTYKEYFDNTEAEVWCTDEEMLYCSDLILKIGNLWSIIVDENILPPNLLMKSESLPDE